MIKKISKALLVIGIIGAVSMTGLNNVGEVTLGNIFGCAKNFVVITVDTLVNGNYVPKNSKASRKSDASEKTGTIISVTDGDTYKVKINGKQKTIRLIGVDTPESVASSNNTRWGTKASNYAKKTLTKGRKVWIKYDKDRKDNYDRVLCYLYIKKDGKKVMFNKLLVKNGYARAAYYSPNGKYRSTFKKLHLTAKKQKKGFWKDGFKKAFPAKKEKSY